MTRIPHTRPGVWPTRRDDRASALFELERARFARVALIGLPDDTGVRLNGGRPGAALGPHAFRAALAGFGTPYDAATRSVIELRVFDAGDVEPAEGNDEAALFETHARVEAALTALHELGLVPACVGGGHDLSLPSIRALSRLSGASLGGLNVDAHLDVRKRVGSGMAFRRLIEEECLAPTRFVEFGLGRFVNDEADCVWLESLGAELITAEQVARREVSVEACLGRIVASGTSFVSIDLDAIDAAAMPGVSALNPAGLDVHVVTALAAAAGATSAVRHFDLMELCPEQDSSGRSARIAAQLFLAYLSGFARRP